MDTYHKRESKLMMLLQSKFIVDGIHIGKLADKLQRVLDEM